MIELLAVIGVIGILAAILIPVVGKARESATKAQCVAQLRSIHQAIGLYLGDNRQVYPPAYGGVIDSSQTWWWYKWESPLAAYAGPKANLSWIKLCICETGRTDANVQPPGVPGYPYVVNYNVMPNYNAALNFRAVNASVVSHPASTLLMADSGRQGVWGVGFSNVTPVENNWGRVAGAHGGRANMLWCDGHVSSESVNEITSAECQL